LGNLIVRGDFGFAKMPNEHLPRDLNGLFRKCFNTF